MTGSVVNSKIDLFATVNFLEKFQNVSRNLPLKSLGRMENDTEHSFNLALVVWKVITADNLPLDVNLAVKYALVHDLVEIYAGDVCAFTGKIDVETKRNNEKLALDKLKQDKSLADFVKYIEQYEGRVDEESRFVYSFDKFMPVISVVNNNVPWYRDAGVSLTKYQTQVGEKVKVSKLAQPYFAQVMAVLREHADLFAESEVD
jgi:putative hydrolase of HD superfamily